MEGMSTMRLKSSLLLLMLVVASVGCTRVSPGYVGIKINMYGSQKGVEDFPLQTGRVWFNVFTEEVYTFPTYMQHAVWTADVHENSRVDESVTFNSVEGAVINADVAASYQIEGEKVPVIFVELRQDAKYITNTYIRSKVRDAFSRHASKMKVVDIFGERKQELLLDVREDLQNELGPKGFKFDMISFVGGLRVDKQVEQSISLTIQATQRAIEAQNKVLQSKAEADQNIEEARGKAEAILLEARAKAEANETLTKSLSPELIQYEALQRWDGVMPRVTGESIPFIQIKE